VPLLNGANTHSGRRPFPQRVRPRRLG
jgi:hypothetical protein